MSRLTIEKQRDYIELLKKIWQKNVRVCGIGSEPELAMLDILVRERAKLIEMEADNA